MEAALQLESPAVEARERLVELVAEVGEGLALARQRENALLYVRGLIEHGGRKSLQPTLFRLEETPARYESMQQFLADSPWDPRLLVRGCAERVAPELGSSARCARSRRASSSSIPALGGSWIVEVLVGDPTAVAGEALGTIASSNAMGRNVLLSWSRQRPLCPDFEPNCLQLLFCEARRCAVDLRRDLTGELAHCPMSGISAVATYRLAPAARRRQAA